MALGGNVQAIPHDAIIRPVRAKPVHASTPHKSTVTSTKPTPAWLNTPSLTQAQMDAEATREANTSIAPQVQGLRGEQATYDAQQKAYQAAMTGFYSALAPYLAQIQGHVSDAYNSAAQTMGNIGQGYAGELGKTAASDNAETNAALARGGQSPIAAPGAGLTNAFAATNGGIQGSSFAQEGAAKAADAANRPAIWAAQGRDSLTEAINKAVAGDQDYADQIKKVYATVPALRDTILKQVQQAEIDKATLQEKYKNDSFNQSVKVAQLKQAGQRIGLQAEGLNLRAQVAAFDQKYKTAGLNLRGQSLQLQANKFAQQTLQSDRTYGLELQRLGISQKSLQLREIAQEYKLQSGGFTPIQTNKFKTSAFNIAQMAFNPNGAVYNSGPNKGKPLPALTYQQAVKELRGAGVPLSIGLAQLNQVYKPGVRGRPFDEASAPGIVGPGLGTQTKIVQIAQGMLGTPYVWGGTAPGKALDCSGFLQQVYRKMGVNIPRTTYAQVKAGKPVKLNELQPGDAVFTEPGKNGPNHVGMYIGNGMVQESPHTGDVNKVISLQNFLTGGFVAARRFVG